MIVLVLFLFFAYCCVFFIYFGRNSSLLDIQGPVLLVTAHPDDECMFFSPVLLSLYKRDIPVDLLCLSSGDYYGAGRVRSEELKYSANLLGIRHLMVIQDANLPDNPDRQWPSGCVFEHICKAARSWKSKSIISFDSLGVSGHQNHCYIHHALNEKSHLFGDVGIYCLKTLGILPKYCIFLAIVLALVENRRNVFCTPLSLIRLPHKAMLLHKSQLMWFRYLYILLSSYMYINILLPLKKSHKR
ncbi:unnamed protein product [Mesocestoides corti]|uniref:N-acetylglucosaminylphosphatidylinositol deacetylase n=1 Tax=Mesocestoides corti TaxID=53468 RepID=A0A0R3UK70_MESCO|nr:unnamed protein product [Mesocestoides corti]